MKAAGLNMSDVEVKMAQELSEAPLSALGPGSVVAVPVLPADKTGDETGDTTGDETDDGPIRLPGRRLRALLPALLLEPNSVVPAHRLMEAVWGEDLPDAPANARGLSRGFLRRRACRKRPGKGAHGTMDHDETAR